MKAAIIRASEEPTTPPANSFRTTLRFSLTPSCSRNGGAASMLNVLRPGEQQETLQAMFIQVDQNAPFEKWMRVDA